MGLIRKLYSFLIDTLQSLLIAAAVFLVMYQFVMRPFQVKGDSMYPTFHNNSYVLTNILGLRFEKPKLGDVIVFKAPPDPEKAFIKRVIGVPGDRVMIKEGKVYLNENLIDESKYLQPIITTKAGSFLREGEEEIVPEEKFIVLGDNRNASSDSREWGFLEKEKIYGFSFFVYWPISEAKLVRNPIRPE